MSTSITFTDSAPPFSQYEDSESFFGGDAPLPQVVGWAVVVGFGALFSVITTIIVIISQKYGGVGHMTSEHFNTAGRSIKTGLTASVIISQWTWAATLLQSSNVAWQYGVSGPFWYASGATIQVILFGVLAIALKRIAPSAHTVCEIVNARWGKTAHKTFLFFCFCANLIVTSMLLLGGASTVEALTGVDYRWASFLIPWGVILYTASGGLQATFLASYIHTVIIFGVLIMMVFVVYIMTYSSNQIYDFLDKTVTYTPEECGEIYTGYEAGKFACGPVDGNRDGSYLTMISSGGLMFGIINIVGNFGTVFVDQSYWQSAIAARPQSAARGYLLGGICWFAIPFTLATSLGLASTALLLPITDVEAGNGLVPPAVATHLLGDAGSVLILIMLFMAIVSTGSAESIAVSSLVAYDIYREYINPEATGEQILKVSRYVIVAFGLLMGALSLVLFEIGLSLGWVYLFMGIVIGSAVAPLWMLLKWSKASGTGAVIAAWSGLVLAIVSWMITARVREGEISIDTLGTNEAMLTGNLVAILSSALIHIVYSIVIDPQEFDFATLDEKITLVEDDPRGLQPEDQDPEMLQEAENWIARRGYVLTLILIVVWPLLSIPAGKFTKPYFAFWVLVAIAWGFGAAIVITILPLIESWDEISNVFGGMFGFVKKEEDEEEEAHKSPNLS
ncbi:MAG: hypothetical protein SGBAC_001886 [Bacillariaceae sp.]